MTEHSLWEWIMDGEYQNYSIVLDLCQEQDLLNRGVGIIDSELREGTEHRCVDAGRDNCSACDRGDELHWLRRVFRQRMAEIDQRLELDAELRWQEEYAAMMKEVCDA